MVLFVYLPLPLDLLLDDDLLLDEDRDEELLERLELELELLTDEDELLELLDGLLYEDLVELEVLLELLE